LPEQVKVAFQTYSRKQVYPTFPEYLDMVVGQMKTFEQVYVIVDALDECTEANGVREELLEGILQLPEFVSVMLTSRHIPGIEVYARNASHLTIRAHEDDIHLHVRRRLSKEKIWGRRIRLDSVLQSKIANSVVERASGMYVYIFRDVTSSLYLCLLLTIFHRFLLAQLHITSIVRKHSRKDVERALKELPEGLAGTYDQILQRINDQGEDDAALALEVLSWLTYVQQPITALTLQHALAIRPQDVDFDEDALIHEETLLEVCSGLVVIDPQSTIIHFVHYTTQEFFLQTRKVVFPASPLNVVTTCLTFLLFEETTKADLPGLYTYVAVNWGHHARESPETQDLVDKIVAFMQDEERLRLCVQQMSSSHSISKSSAMMSSLHLAAKFDLAMTMARLLARHSSRINAQDDEGKTPLYHAAAAKNGCVVRLLLERDDVDIDLPSYFDGPPLHSAIDSGQQEIVKNLITRGVNVESKDAQGQRPIHKAIKLGLSDTLLALLEKKVDVTATTHSGHTPLELAMPIDSKMRQKSSTGIWRKREVSGPLTGYTPCLRILLDSYSIEKINDGGMLFEAVKDGRPDIVELFLTKGASPSLRSAAFNQRIALHWAAEKGFDKIVELLLGYGSDATSQDIRGYTPLHYASSAGRDGAVLLLVAAMKDLDLKAQNGLTAYQTAKLQGHEAIAGVLLKAGAKDLPFPSAFELDASSIETRHKNNLLGRNRDAITQSRTLSGQTISGAEYKHYSERLISAAQLGDVEGVLLCLSKGVDVGERDHEHSKTALHWAAENGHINIALLLLDWNSDLTSQDQYGETALHYAAESGHADIVDAFLKRTPILNLRDDRGRTPLRCARDNYHLEAVTILLKQWNGTRGEAEEKDAQGKSLVHWAAEAGLIDVMKKLNNLQLGESAFTPDERHWTPLIYATKQKDTTVIEMLT
jgi:ankyrin repeat protein